MIMNKLIYSALLAAALLLAAPLAGGSGMKDTDTPEAVPADPAAASETGSGGGQLPAPEDASAQIEAEEVSLRDDMRFSEYSKIRSGSAVLYRNPAGVHGELVVCVNAGHGTRGGEKVKTRLYPDISGRGTAEGYAITTGMVLSDGVPERDVTLAAAKRLKDELLSRGFSVLMIREEEDVQLDNIARAVLANTYADCHVALHWDSSTSDKGAFFISTPDDAKAAEPVKSTWERSEALGDSLLEGLRGRGVRIFGSGKMASGLTQTSYSTVPNVVIELGDKASDHGDEALALLAQGLADGIEAYLDRKR